LALSLPAAATNRIPRFEDSRIALASAGEYPEPPHELLLTTTLCPARLRAFPYWIALIAWAILPLPELLRNLAATILVFQATPALPIELFPRAPRIPAA
jgi:hypothetical protein